MSDSTKISTGLPRGSKCTVITLEKNGENSGSQKALLLSLSLLLVFIGGIIYVLFRTQSLRLFRWISALGLSEHVSSLREACAGITLPDFVLYSVPDFFWLIAYLLIVNAIVPKSDKKTFLFWLCLLPVYAIVHEILQGFHVVPGVFDIVDLLCYIIPLFINLMFLPYEKTT